jgi:hypothetical protein
MCRQLTPQDPKPVILAGLAQLDLSVAIAALDFVPHFGNVD